MKTPRELIPEFVKSSMLRQLEANKHKGDNWHEMTDKQILFELYYHVGKLQAALMAKDILLINEYCGDIANIVGFTLDIKS